MTTLTRSARPTLIDMLDPAATCAHLQVSETGLIELVNQSALPAYRLGGQVRFRYRDVSALASGTVAAA